MEFGDFVADGLNLYITHLLHPSQIPGTDIFSKIYAMGVLPVLIIAMTIVQQAIGMLVMVVKYTKIGAHCYEIFFNDQIALFDETDAVDPEGNDEAIRQLGDREPKVKPTFSYHVANLLLIMSSMTYQRNEKLVAEASKILLNVKNEAQRDKATKLLEDSEYLIDEKSRREFGMAFSGISELKTLGGPYAGLFYNDDTIVLVFKGTSVLAFNEYLLDVTIQRVDASEYLYGEVHKGFYESLFPDAKPIGWYESMTYDQTNPFNTIMETIFKQARISKCKTGKPVNLWLAGHSLGGALAAMVMARLQMPVRELDPLMTKEDEFLPKGDHYIPHQGPGTSPRTVLQEMLAKFSNDPDLVVLRDCYSVASPKVGDSTFAEEFARNHLQFCYRSPYKTTYWRLVADMDIVPRMPPGISVDPKNPHHNLLPLVHSSTSCSWLNDEQQQDKEDKASLPPDRSTDTLFSQLDEDQHPKINGSGQYPHPKHLHSLLDYQHVGQLIEVYNSSKAPTVGPSAFEADLSEGVLRKKGEKRALLKELSELSNTWKAKDEGPGNPLETSVVRKSTIKMTRMAKTTTSTLGSESREQAQVRKIIYDLEEMSRLRQPNIFERILLSLPSLLSHAPATYQRNLVRARFYFKSFPGPAFEERVGQLLVEGQTQREEKVVTKDTGVIAISERNGQIVQVEDHGGEYMYNEEFKLEMTVDLDMKKTTKKTISRKQHRAMSTETTVTRTTTMHPHEE
ncbi:hypothetical protein BGX28_010236 [Mortierella sp. GBA30]|nr:hypothetical protein BGX28_010236 [Mortierella sp. GBA30]